MRIIEQKMNDAISNGKNWQSGNTKVEFNAEDHTSTVFLHGNKIAVVGETSLQLFDGGYQSNTTKSRLNAILQDHGCEGDYIFQKNYQWFFHTADDEVFPFQNGMMVR